MKVCDTGAVIQSRERGRQRGEGETEGRGGGGMKQDMGSETVKTQLEAEI